MVFGFWKKSPLSLEPGDDVELTFSPTVGSSVVEIMQVQGQNRDGIILSIPEKYRTENLFTPEMVVQVYVRSGEMLGNFFTRIKQVEKNSAGGLLHLSIPDRVRWVEIDLSNLPFRDYRRVEAHVPVEIGYGQLRIPGVTTDISGGGVKLLTGMFIPEDETVEIRLALPESSVFAKARVIRARKRKTPHPPDEMFRLALEFTDINGDSRNRIIYFCMNLPEPA